MGIDAYLKTESKSTSMGTSAVMRSLDRIAIVRLDVESGSRFKRLSNES